MEDKSQLYKELFDACNNDPKKAFELIEKGYEASYKDPLTKTTALHIAVRHYNIKLALELIEHASADLQAKDSNGYTPIEHAMFLNFGGMIFELARQHSKYSKPLKTKEGNLPTNSLLRKHSKVNIPESERTFEFRFEKFFKSCLPPIVSFFENVDEKTAEVKTVSLMQNVLIKLFPEYESKIVKFTSFENDYLTDLLKHIDEKNKKSDIFEEMYHCLNKHISLSKGLTGVKLQNYPQEVSYQWVDLFNNDVETLPYKSKYICSCYELGKNGNELSQKEKDKLLCLATKSNDLIMIEHMINKDTIFSKKALNHALKISTQMGLEPIKLKLENHMLSSKNIIQSSKHNIRNLRRRTRSMAIIENTNQTFNVNSWQNKELKKEDNFQQK